MADIDAHAGSSRIPILFCGPLLHRLGEAFIPDLGGCRIGDRPIDYHLEVLRNFGAIVEKLPSGIRMSAPGGLHGAKVALPYPSVGATEQVLLTAVLADGITELSGAAIDNITKSQLDELVVTDTIPLSEAAKACGRIRQLSVAELLAETIRRIAFGESVSSLYVD